MNTPTSTTAAHRAARHPSGDNVDIVDTRPTPRPVAAVTRGRPGGMSVPRPMPIPTKLSRPPQPVVGDGPSGPDAGRVRSLHETRRRALKAKRSEERRVGKEGVSTCRDRGAQDP